jgi:hypothetical protein
MAKEAINAPYEIQPMGLLSSLLSDFREAGGVIDYVLIGGMFPAEFADVYAFHRQAAGFTLEAATARYPRSSIVGPTSWREPEKAEGKQIMPADFFAPGYLGLPFELDRNLFQKEQKRFRLEPDKSMTSWGKYYSAFSHPPYTLSGPYDPDNDKWFSTINYELFGDDGEALTIYEWSTDWADYFNAGHEWWGSSLWTVYSEQTQWLVGIAALASD